MYTLIFIILDESLSPPCQVSWQGRTSKKTASSPIAELFRSFPLSHRLSPLATHPKNKNGKHRKLYKRAYKRD